MTKLRQCKLALQENLEIIKQLDDEILRLVDDEEVEHEIEQADTFKERIQRAMIDSSRALETREGMVTITPSTPLRDSSSPPIPTVPTTTSVSTSAVSSGSVGTLVTSSAVTSVSGISPTLVSTHAGDLPSSLTAGHTKVKLPKLD